MSLCHVSKKIPKGEREAELIAPTYGSRYMQVPVQKYTIPDESMPAQVAYQLIHDELLTEARPIQNLATFVTTWMEPEADKLMKQNMRKNLVNFEEYPQTHEIAQRCVTIVADLLHGGEHAVGAPTVGSTEACMLAGITMKTLWKASNPSKDAVPNLIMSRSVQCAWLKFCTYFEVEARVVSPAEGSFVISAEDVEPMIDANTIGVVAIMGTTMTGHYEPVNAIGDLLERINQKQDFQIPIHVDAAIGGFFAPFMTDELPNWDFLVPSVQSMNVSGHKYGLTYPGIGFAIWRAETQVPMQLRFMIDYLGKEQDTISLNFSRSAAPVIAQYYNFLRLGRAGYRNVMEGIRGNACYLANRISSIHSAFSIISDPEAALPVIVIILKDGASFELRNLARALRFHGWVVPCYKVYQGKEAIDAIRIVARECLSRDQADLIAQGFIDSLREINALDGSNISDDNAMPEKSGATREHHLTHTIC